MRVLLDTHSFLWFVTDNTRLSSSEKAVIVDGENQLFHGRFIIDFRIILTTEIERAFAHCLKIVYIQDYIPPQADDAMRHRLSGIMLDQCVRQVLYLTQ